MERYVRRSKKGYYIDINGAQDVNLCSRFRITEDIYRGIISKYSFKSEQGITYFPTVMDCLEFLREISQKFDIIV